MTSGLRGLYIRSKPVVPSGVCWCMNENHRVQCQLLESVSLDFVCSEPSHMHRCRAFLCVSWAFLLHLALPFVAAAGEPVGEAGRPRDVGMRYPSIPCAGEGPVVPQRGRDLHITRLHDIVLGRPVYVGDCRGVSWGLGHLPLYGHSQRRSQQHHDEATSRRSVYWSARVYSVSSNFFVVPDNSVLQ